MSSAPAQVGDTAEPPIDDKSGIDNLESTEDAMPAAPPVAATPAAAAAAAEPEPSPGGPATSAADNRASQPAATNGSSSSSKSSSNDAAAPKPSEPEGEEQGPAAAGTGSASTSEGELGESSDEEDVGDASELISRLKQVLSIDDEVGVKLAPPSLLPSFDLEGVAELIRAGRVRRIICMCGAGISVSAGIPDFRSPGTGLYSRLQKYNLPYPHAVFEMSFFRKNPRPFFLLAKELFPGNYLPTPTHFFMKLLHDKGLLLRCFTQNIDSLEHQAGLPEDAVVAAHGNFDSAKCIRCGRPHSIDYVRKAVFETDGNSCYCEKQSCGGLVKPDIVFFGESLPGRFHDCAAEDFPKADLLIVMGTSLVVHPFAGLIDYVDDEVPRLLINREKAGEPAPEMRALGYRRGFNFGTGNYRDALFLGDCDDGVRQLCRLLGWEADLDALIAAGRQSFHPAYAAPAEGPPQPGVAVYQ
ncbi:hypothetical protein ABPG77_010271 [Micractinium sp. CCAP 211/92]